MSHKMASNGGNVLIVMEAVFAAILGGFWLPSKIGRWCFRLLTAIVFLVYLILAIDVFSTAKQTPSARQGPVSPSPYKLLYGFLIIGLPCLWYSLKGRFSIWPQATAEELAAEEAAKRQIHEDRLLQPDWTFYEQHLQRPAPAALHALYADKKWITSTLLGYSDACSINTFEPLNEDSLIESDDDPTLRIVPIATTDFGDPVYLKPGPTEPDAVYVTWHDGGDTEVLADSVSHFVEHLKQTNKAVE